jgi:hypothetical protein
LAYKVTSLPSTDWIKFFLKPNQLIPRTQAKDQ